MQHKKTICAVILFFSLFTVFTRGKKDAVGKGGKEFSYEEEILESSSLDDKEKILGLKDFAQMHNSDFVCALDYFNQCKMLIKNSKCYPVCSLNNPIKTYTKLKQKKQNQDEKNNPEVKTTVNAEELKNDAKALFMLSIVFPEMMRYSAFRDEIETRVTSVMYSCGSDSLICSIGYMQMKPNFASHIERCIQKYPDLEERYGMLNQQGNDFTFDQRRDRIKRLKTLDFQIQYLSAFIDYAVKRYHLSDKDTEYQLRILSTAYNAGLSYSEKDLMDITKVKAFPNGTNAKGSLWNYSDLTVQFYNYVANGFSFG